MVGLKHVSGYAVMCLGLLMACPALAQMVDHDDHANEVSNITSYVDVTYATPGGTRCVLSDFHVGQG